MFNAHQLTMRAFAWRPKQIPLKKWNIVKGDQVSQSNNYEQKLCANFDPVLLFLTG